MFEHIKKVYKKNEKVILIVLIISFAIIAGLKKSQTADFNSINGSFQNYNPVRRFLDGQVPYRDFSVYLGTGHLYILSFFQKLIGNNFINSLFITNMLTFLFYELVVLILGLLIFKNAKFAMKFSIGGGVVNLLRPSFLTSLFNNEFINALDFGLTVGNSARLIRNFVPFVLVALLLIGNRFFKNSKNNYIRKNNSLIFKIYWACLSGIFILWSNDGGISNYLASSFVYFLLLIKEYKKDIKGIIKDTCTYILVSILMFFLALEIVTHGSILSWFKYTFGVSSYQGWYYSLGPNKLNYSLYVLDITLHHIIMLLIIIYYIYHLFKSNEETEKVKYSCLSLVCLTSLISSLMYMLISGGRLNGFLNLILYTLGFGYIVKFLLTTIKNKEVLNKIKIVLTIITVAVLINTGWLAIKNIKLSHLNEKAVYVKELGSYLTKYGKSLQFVKQFLKDDKVFSTYASAIETITNQFQPSGTDYIIHCLGDEQRKDYMLSFEKQNFKYVATTDKDEIEYRYWIKNANWFFYKELYKSYVPVFSTEYNVLWQKSENRDQIKIESNLNIIKNSQNKYTLEVKTNNSSFNGVANIKLSYNSNLINSFFKSGDLVNYVYVTETTENKIISKNLKSGDFNIPKNSNEYYIPITIINGVGRVSISSVPIKNTNLVINDASIEDIFDVNFKYAVASKNEFKDENIVYVDKSTENIIILKNAKQIKNSKSVANILKYEENGNYIKLHIDKKASLFKYPYYFEVS